MHSFPISLRADSTTYVYKYEDSKKNADTLTIFYEREFRYKGDCGFVVNANKPRDGRTHRSTFEKVEVRYGKLGRHLSLRFLLRNVMGRRTKASVYVQYYPGFGYTPPLLNNRFLYSGGLSFQLYYKLR